MYRVADAPQPKFCANVYVNISLFSTYLMSMVDSLPEFLGLGSNYWTKPGVHPALEYYMGFIDASNETVETEMAYTNSSRRCLLFFPSTSAVP
jgi:hypothetical protein